MIKKLRIKFVIINMSIVLLLLYVMFALVLHLTKANFETASIHMMRSIANGPFRQERPTDRGRDGKLPFFVIQLDSNNEPTAINGGNFDLSDEALIDEILEKALSSSDTWGVIPDYNLRYFRADKSSRHFVVFADTSNEAAMLGGLMRICYTIGALSFLAFLTASIFLSKWAVKPVDRAWKDQRQFIANASHELKTPLTVIFTNAELLQSSDYTPEDKLRFSDNIIVMARKMRSLTERLLDLARMDSGQAQMAFTRVNFSKIVSDAILPFEPMFFEKGLMLESHIEDGLMVNGDAEKLAQAVEILLDNAQKYSKCAGKTTVLLRKHNGRCLLNVSNEGEEISKSDLKNIFQRFYRIDQARVGDGSFGLGLSIAQSIVDSHRGRIWVESKNGVNAFYVEFLIA
ncbi:MAG: sensor histidine kinase [Christensenellales bacterium]